jgi:exonuclease SbcC
MIPIRLKIQGFLSYREAAEVDFTGFELACISGPNGAGKSSLLDAMTWALFGQARKRDEALIHAAATAAEVVYVFSYEGSLYRIQRALARGKSSVLEFQIGMDGDPASTEWRPLTEKTVRETQARIEQILHLDYDTFVNASFFLQGKADLFTQQRPADRKRILANILGLDAWEVYRERTAERRRRLDGELGALDGRMQEIEAELSEEAARKARLGELETQLAGLTAARIAQTEALDGIRRIANGLAEQRRLVESLAARSGRAEEQRGELVSRLADREAERSTHADLLARAKDIEAAERAWQKSRARLEEMEVLASQFREQEKQRQPFLDAINAERAKLEQERIALLGQEAAATEHRSELETLRKELAVSEAHLAEAEARLQLRDQSRAQLERSLQRRTALRERVTEAADGRNQGANRAHDRHRNPDLPLVWPAAEPRAPRKHPRPAQCGGPGDGRPLAREQVPDGVACNRGQSA